MSFNDDALKLAQHTRQGKETAKKDLSRDVWRSNCARTVRQWFDEVGMLPYPSLSDGKERYNPLHTDITWKFDGYEYRMTFKYPDTSSLQGAEIKIKGRWLGGNSKEDIGRALIGLGETRRKLVASREWFRKQRYPLIGLMAILTMIAVTVGLTAGEDWWIVAPLLLIALIIGVTFIRIPRERFARHFGWLPVVVGAATYPMWYFYSNRLNITPASQFFEISAQVLPVLLLAAVIDIEWSRALKIYRLLFPIVVVFLGELIALRILAFGEQSSHLQATTADFAIVAASLTSTAIVLVMAVLGDLPENEQKNADSSGVQSKPGRGDR